MRQEEMRQEVCGDHQKSQAHRDQEQLKEAKNFHF